MIERRLADDPGARSGLSQDTRGDPVIFVGDVRGPNVIKNVSSLLTIAVRTVPHRPTKFEGAEEEVAAARVEGESPTIKAS